VLEYGDQSRLVASHQFLERGRIVVAHLQHEPDVRIAEFVAQG
jgi:hypothetical protein